MNILTECLTWENFTERRIRHPVFRADMMNIEGETPDHAEVAPLRDSFSKVIKGILIAVF